MRLREKIVLAILLLTGATAFGEKKAIPPARSWVSDTIIARDLRGDQLEKELAARLQ